MKKKATTANPPASDTETLIHESAPPPRLAVLTRTINGMRSRCAKLDGGRLPAPKKGGLYIAKICHVGYVEINMTTEADGAIKTRWREVVNLAEFDGPNSERSADEFITLLKGRTRTSAARCIADGPPVRVKRWRQRHNYDETTVRYV